MTDKITHDTYVAANEANSELGHVKVETGEHLLSTKEGGIVLDRYEVGMKDKLTGLLKKDVWESEAELLFDYSKRQDKPFGMLYIDINDFKTFNDEVSHLFGDEVIKLVAEAIKHSVRTTDVAGRVGGDESAVALPDTDYETIKVIRDRILSNLEQLKQKSDSENILKYNPTITIGVAVAPNEGKTFKEVLLNADKHMKELKTLNKHGR